MLSRSRLANDEFRLVLERFAELTGSPFSRILDQDQTRPSERFSSAVNISSLRHDDGTLESGRRHRTLWRESLSRIRLSHIFPFVVGFFHFSWASLFCRFVGSIFRDECSNFTDTLLASSILCAIACWLLRETVAIAEYEAPKDNFWLFFHSSTKLSAATEPVQLVASPTSALLLDEF
jgi:hypothetical protein